jgi:hypothetical protein
MSYEYAGLFASIQRLTRAGAPFSIHNGPVVALHLRMGFRRLGCCLLAPMRAADVAE